MSKEIMEPSNKSGWRRWLWPLRSRKVLVAVATCVVAWAAEANIVLSPETVLVVLAAGVSVIVGIAIEDAGEKAGK